jgi:hypothetical protein
MTDDDSIFAEIEALLAPHADAGLEQVENTLTTGYATALQLEAARWRLERRIAEAATLAGDGKRGAAQELAELARQLTEADDELSRLRNILGSLRDRAAEIRAAA